MRVKKVEDSIETELDNTRSDLAFGFWDVENEEFIPLTEQNAASFGINVELVDAIQMFAADITEKLNAINRDLKQLGSKIL